MNIPGSNQIVETKHDSAAKLAYVEDKPHNEHLFADEFNALVSYVRTLWTLQNFDGSLVIPSRKKALGTLTGGQTFVQKINSMANSTFPAPCFVTYTISGVDYVQAFVGIEGSYGSGNPVSADKFILVQQSDQEQPTLPQRRILYGYLSGTIFTAGKNTLQPEVTFTQVGEWVKTNILFFPTLYVHIIDEYAFGIEGGGYARYIWDEFEGYLSFKCIAYDTEGNQSDGGEFSNTRMLIEQL